MTNFENATGILTRECLRTQICGEGEWPKNTVLYQPYETEQILMPESSECLAVKTFLKMLNLDFIVEARENAEYMSPHRGKVPFIKAGQFLIAGFEPIVNFAQTKGYSLSTHLSETQKWDLRVYMSLVYNILLNAEIYVTWNHESTYKEITKQRYSSVYPFPLNHLATYYKRQSMLSLLEVLNWKKKTLDEVFKDVDKICESLSSVLGNKKYFFDEKPTELDALVFGHLFTIITTPLLNNRFATTVRNYDNLVKLCVRIETEFFQSRTL
ncbi:metaxin-2-like [Adelges cooleyi]|uniref:metaxin-2-like n=1 Tax=Adelges cooleyi TaxID=133065 RepID=UPI0021801869|nr:metaxin-2-like [Adelges cooleyi]XP_050430150.1 metaxin-2-like [Adelges cooleyi]